MVPAVVVEMEAVALVALTLKILPARTDKRAERAMAAREILTPSMFRNGTSTAPWTSSKKRTAD